MKRKTILQWLVGIIGVGVVYALLVFGLILSTYREVPPQGIDTMIVLGAKAWGNEPSPILKERLDAAVPYLQTNPQTVVIVTGGQGPDEIEPEGVVMGRYLESKGIDANRIIVESTSTTTVENIQNAAKLHDISTAIVVSNDFHIYRAKRTATQNGVNTVYGLAAPSKTKATFVSYLREVVALGYHLIFTH